MAREISNAEDVIDSRDVIARIEELEETRDDLQTSADDAASDREDLADDADDSARQDADKAFAAANDSLAEWRESEDAAELKALTEFAAEAADYADDWRYGATLIRDSYWTEYVEELLRDIGDLPQNIPSYIVIDWEATGENIKVDYTSVEFGGVTYWVR